MTSPELDAAADVPGAFESPETVSGEAVVPLEVTDGASAAGGSRMLDAEAAGDAGFGDLAEDTDPALTAPAVAETDDADLLDEQPEDRQGADLTEARTAVTAALDEADADPADGGEGDRDDPNSPTGGSGGNGGNGGESGENGEAAEPGDEAAERLREAEARDAEAEREQRDLEERVAQRERAVDICARGGFSDFVDLAEVPESATNVEAPTKLLGFGEDNKVTWSNVNPDRPGDKPSYAQRMLLNDREVAFVDSVVTQPGGVSEQDLAFLDRVRAEVNSGYGDEVTRQNMPVVAAMRNLMAKTDGTIVRTEDGNYRLADGVKVVDNRQRGNSDPVDEETVAEMRGAIREIMSDL